MASEVPRRVVAAAGVEPVVYVNRPMSQQTAAEYVRDMWAHRDVVRAFAVRNIKIRYKETFFGVAWIVIQPLVLVLPFILVLGRIAHIGGGGVPYAAFACAVIVLWQFCSSTINLGTAALLAEAPLARKVYFPRLSPILATMLAALVDLGIAYCIAVPASWLLGGHPSVQVLWLPLVVLLALPGVLSLSMALGILNVHYRDVRYALPLVTQVLLYASPVSYALPLLSRQGQYLFCSLNPLAAPLDGARRVIALGEAPDWTLTALGCGCSLVFFILGSLLFRRLERDLADLV